MKIKKLHFADHPFFGTTDMDFTDRKGRPLNTVVLAGINGSGKTTILNHIRELIREGIIRLSVDRCDAVLLRSGMEKNLETSDHLTVFLTDFEKEITQGAASSVTGNNAAHLFRRYAEKYLPEKKSAHLLPKFVFLPSEISFDQMEITNRPYKYEYSFFNQADGSAARFIPDYFATLIDRKVYENEDIPPRESVRQACDEINAIFEKLDLESEVAGLRKDGSRMSVFRNRSGREFDITGLSSGERQLFFRIMALKMFEAENSVILADEPEISLHPAWQQNILKVYENVGENNQVVVATHSPHIIASAPRKNVRILTRNEETGTFQMTGCDDICVAKGAPAERILKDLMGLPTTRDPEIQEKIDSLWKLILKGEFESEKFRTGYEELEALVGTTDEDMVLMKMEIGKRKWEAGRDAEN